MSSSATPPSSPDSRKSVRRAAAKTSERGRSRITVHPGTVACANASTWLLPPPSPSVSEMTPSLAAKRAGSSSRSGRRKPATTAWLRRSTMARPARPRLTVDRLARFGLTGSVAVSTPLIAPLASLVGTDETKTCSWVSRAVSPSLTNGFPVSIAALKYERSETSAMRPGFGLSVLTRTMPFRLTHESPPGNSLPPDGWTRSKYASMAGSSARMTAGALAIDESVPSWPPK